MGSRTKEIKQSRASKLISSEIDCLFRLTVSKKVDFTPIRGIPKLKEDSQWEDQEQAVLTACSSLIAVVDDGRPLVVQFLHFSVKEFLTSERLATSKMDASRHDYIRLDEVHTIMAQACLSILLRLDYVIDRERIESSPLVQNAAERFNDHVEFEDVLSQIRNVIVYLFEKLYFAAWLWMCSGFYRDRHPRKDAVPLHHLVELGYLGLEHCLISKRPEDKRYG